MLHLHFIPILYLKLAIDLKISFKFLANLAMQRIKKTFKDKSQVLPALLLKTP